ncbi:4-(cytidine 5'-diphospho)-2-C-methyl-D-erythritol kinase [Alicyclobacillus acidocaldarius]|uniref:4-diphosphocytidyl-2-C-methyl-D-erythritol kinase n=1 Tax=Alicyclobacillus acidocaldarius subsp. acidocaldarius (strain ATCC 27009 / DSM 446 / BCRC 14685 / JCM 5260 / KCTC 1825 / NBRC 15652 / NCIMB 11725 / NRRL B-14509 / 104-IA) TaxID=521098 RepID=C8WQQ9_ALIAD|nr:4-(cytidine 5'-diphospho)-2-C-methyl-D-erythritol kinase [Alicyclobacillus acidocaldarius]ACV57237.1 4-diphosphocytidyl-2C-methyl-D-erythritolkinase [Alicyclobacillus acidocaldarius subsp. acidocaldarius DSM 446]
MLFQRAYAKINLTLDVLGRRDDGYHEVDMVMQTVDLSDVVWLEARDDGEITMESTSSSVPVDERNLCVQAAHAFRRRTGFAGGVHIQLEKHIPVAAGLAGGSSDAAAVLRGLNQLAGAGLTLDELADIGAEVGSDVPYCVYGGLAIARGRGERVTRYAHVPAMYAVLLHPRIFVSTADVYRGLQPSDFTSSPRSEEMVRCLAEGDHERAVSLVHNALERVTLSLYPELRALKERVTSIAQRPVHMSGSGPTMFVLTPVHTHAQRLYNALRGIMKDVYVCRFVGGYAHAHARS